MSIYLIASWIRFRKTIKINWLRKVKKEIKNYKKYYHLIILPTYKEPYEVIRKTFLTLINCEYPKDRFIIFLGGEERDRENFLQIAEKIKQEFGDKFYKLSITVHPKDLPGELAGKGANENYIGHQAKKFINKEKIPYKDVIVSCFDIDTRPHLKYFAHLVYKYATVPNPTRFSYQPVATYNNNIWDSPSFIRVTANSTTFWLLTDLARPERLFTFSSHSMSFRALVDVDFWQKDIVTEDSRICLQCLVRYDGDYQVMPMYMPVSMDTVYTGSIWRGIVDQYKQQRRWAYGAENAPYLIWHLLSGKSKMSNLKKFRYLWNQLEGTYSWATAPILISILGRLPLYMLGDAGRATVIAQNAPDVLHFLMTSAMIGLVFCAIISTLLLPSKPKTKKWYSYPIMILQWILFPITMVIFGSIPATEAQTRLMLGKYLGFNVTTKVG